MFLKPKQKKFLYAPAVWGKASGSGGAATTWDPLNNYGTTLTSSNTIATCTVPPFDQEGVRSVGTVSGKKYVEFIMASTTSAANWTCGFVDSTFPISSPMGALINVANAVGARGDSLLNYNGTSVFYAASSPVNGDNISIAIDTTANKIWARLNGGSWNNTTDDPATNTGGISISGIGGTLYAACRLIDNNSVCTAKFSSASWSFTAPSGFSQI